jgi:uncharacterized protein YkuJ
MEKRLLIPISIALTFVFTHIAYAHHTFALKEKAGDYVAEMKFVAEGIFADDPSDFTFNLRTADESKTVAFTDVEVKTVDIYKRIVFMGTVKATESTHITYAFPDTGDFRITLRFIKDGKDLASATFPMTVMATPVAEPERKGFLSRPIFSRPLFLSGITGLVGGTVGLVFGVLAMKIFGRKNPN